MGFCKECGLTVKRPRNHLVSGRHSFKPGAALQEALKEMKENFEEIRKTELVHNLAFYIITFNKYISNAKII